MWNIKVRCECNVPYILLSNSLLAGCVDSERGKQRTSQGPLTQALERRKI